MRRFCISLMVIGMLCAVSDRAHGAPILVTGGTTFLWWSGDPGGFSLTGEGVTVTGHKYSGWGFGPAAVGNTYNFDNVLYPMPIGGSIYTPTTLDGVWMNAFLVGSLSFFTDDFTVPNLPGAITIQMPFRMTGHFLGYDSPARQNLLFDIDLVGYGTASATASAWSDGWVRASGVNYTFHPVSVPEPTFLTLFAAGVGGFALRQVLRRGLGASVPERYTETKR